MHENDKNAKINGKNYLMKIEPKIIDDSLFIGLDDVSEILNANVSYFDNTEKTDVHIIRNVYDDEKMMRYLITNMKVESENDRFYIIPIIHEFWIDKYA